MNPFNEPIEAHQVYPFLICGFQAVLDLMPGVLFGHGVYHFLKVKMPAINISV